MDKKSTTVILGIFAIISIGLLIYALFLTGSANFSG